MSDTIKYLDKLNDIKNRYSIPYTKEDMKEEHCVEIMYEELSIEMIKEIERLNNKNEELLTLYTTEREVKDYYKNIINELDNWLEENRYHIEEYDGVLTYLRKLKGDDKE